MRNVFESPHERRIGRWRRISNLLLVIAIGGLAYVGWSFLDIRSELETLRNDRDRIQLEQAQVGNDISELNRFSLSFRQMEETLEAIQHQIKGLEEFRTTATLGTGENLVQLLALKEAWVRISKNQERIFEGTLASGEARDFSFDSDETLSVETGRANAIQVRLNGQGIGLLGEAEDYKEVVFRSPFFEVGSASQPTDASTDQEQESEPEPGP
ncbi:MAG: DUF4115 domain-containing protein [Candidatus Bipolaricaulia bacterium]